MATLAARVTQSGRTAPVEEPGVAIIAHPTLSPVAFSGLLIKLQWVVAWMTAHHLPPRGPLAPALAQGQGAEFGV